MHATFPLYLGIRDGMIPFLPLVITRPKVESNAGVTDSITESKVYIYSTLRFAFQTIHCDPHYFIYIYISNKQYHLAFLNPRKITIIFFKICSFKCEGFFKQFSSLITRKRFNLMSSSLDPLPFAPFSCLLFVYQKSTNKL